MRFYSAVVLAVALSAAALAKEKWTLHEGVVLDFAERQHLVDNTLGNDIAGVIADGILGGRSSRGQSLKNCLNYEYRVRGDDGLVYIAGSESCSVFDRAIYRPVVNRPVRYALRKSRNGQMLGLQDDRGKLRWLTLRKVVDEPAENPGKP